MSECVLLESGQYCAECHVVIEADEYHALLRVIRAAEKAESLLEALAVDDIKGKLLQPYRQIYADVHTQLKEALEALPEHLRDD